MPSPRLRSVAVVAACLVSAICTNAADKALPKDTARVPVTFSGGHETNPVDRGRPVVLIASALGVAPEVFRAAFSHVHPAGPGSGGPTGEEARQNKAALMGALGKYSITNERLDAVSDYYRYPPGSDRLWKTRPAFANALVKGGAVVGFEITDGGSGYTSAPTVAIPGVSGANAMAELAFTKAFETNGSVKEIKMVAAGSR